MRLPQLRVEDRGEKPSPQRGEGGNDDLLAIFGEKGSAVTVYSVYEPPMEAPDLASRRRGASLRQGGVLLGRALRARHLADLSRHVARAWAFILLSAARLARRSERQHRSRLDERSPLSLLFAFEANDLRGAALERRGYKVARHRYGTRP